MRKGRECPSGGMQGQPYLYGARHGDSLALLDALPISPFGTRLYLDYSMGILIIVYAS